MLKMVSEQPPDFEGLIPPRMARDGKGRGGRLEEVVSYGRKLEASVNFYVEAVSGYDDTTDCSVRWVVYRSTIR